MMIQQMFRLVLGVGLVVLSAAAPGQGYPARPVRIIVPFPPGAGPDIVARTVGQKLSEHWKQQIVVDNRPGGGNIATELAANAAPDGYTLLFASNHVTINPSLFSKVPYDPVRDFVAVTLAAATPNIVVVHPSLPVKSVKDLIALAKSRPGQLNFSSGGNVGFLIAPAALPHVKSGRLRALAVTGKRRSPAALELPTVAEAGLPGYEIVAWQGVFAPAATPGDIVKKIYLDVIAALNAPEIKRALTAQGLETIASTSEEFSAYIKGDLLKWAKVVREANVRVD